ncbi:MAG: hypothetical protein M1830_000647 [Pleopsidium flavum]|nr:MAG: hypothetical protein M1830_000647 [Pleopsidium flavum]
MSKNRKLTDFFKPFAPSRTKRSLPIDGDGDSTAVDRNLPDIWSTSPQKEVNAAEEPAAAASQYSIQGHRYSIPTSPVVEKGDYLEPQLGAAGSTTNGNSSFSASQSTSFKSRNRFVRNGEVVIRSSDDEASASDSSLDDVDDLLTARKPMVESSLLTAAEDVNPPTEWGARSTSSQTKTRKSRSRGHLPFSSPLPVMPKYKFSLDSLVRQTERETASEVDVAKARSLFRSSESAVAVREDSNQGEFSVASTGTGPHELNESLLASVVSGSGEGAALHKVLHAMKRTEVLHRGNSWAFFNGGHPLPIREVQPFPVQCLPSQAWQVLLKADFELIFNSAETPSRQQIFLSGHLEEMMKRVTLPDEIFHWILHSGRSFPSRGRSLSLTYGTACVEPREDLRHAYMRSLKHAEDHARRLVQPSVLDELFGQLGAKAEAVDIRHTAVPEPMQLKSKRGRLGMPSLGITHDRKPVSEVGLSIDAREHAICLVARLTLDSSASRRSDVSRGIEDALTSLICSIPESELEVSVLRTSQVIFGFTTDTQLRLLLVSNLPTYAPALGLLRRRLALAFFFEDSSYLSKASDDLLTLDAVTTHLLNPAFEVKEDMDFAQLAARISILDIGIDHGKSSISACGDESEAVFNREVDSLAKRIKTMFISIVDSGASHMTRTEAKEVLEVVHYRLVYAVRTKQKPRLTLFGSAVADGQSEGQEIGSFMTKFLSRGRS